MKMFIVLLCLLLLFRLTNSFVAVRIHQNSIYKPDSLCSFIRNATWLNEVAVENCIWECVNEYNCQTATFFQNEKKCSLFKERCEKGLIQSSSDQFNNVICYRKNHDPISTCLSTLTTHLKDEESTTSLNRLTTERSQTIIRLTRKNDSIFGICNTTVGGDSTASSGNSPCYYPANENPSNAIDNSSSTKYASFIQGTSPSAINGCNTGFYITLSIGPTILTAIQFVTANDCLERNPMTITIEGTNSTSLTQGSSWTLIYSGSSGLENITGKFEAGVKQSINNNTIPYISYRLLVTSKRASGNGVQYAEAILLGYY